jgi:4-diphosphocytidyl-2-C-methyl-D-erythritol kinase
MPGVPAPDLGAVGTSVTVLAPAKLTRSLAVTGRRIDGYHTLEAEMVSIDLCDELTFEPGRGLAVVDRVVGGLGVAAVHPGPGNLVNRALAAVGREAAVRLVKRIPAGAGLGGGSADAAGVIRWAGGADPEVVCRLGADVPFCVTGGRALVRGIGEEIEPLPFEDRRFLLCIPPLAVDTAACYRKWDRMGGPRGAAGNDLEPAAVALVPELARWRDALGDLTGSRPQLAGSGATWFVEGVAEGVAVATGGMLSVEEERGVLVPVRSVPATADGEVSTRPAATPG